MMLSLGLLRSGHELNHGHLELLSCPFHVRPIEPVLITFSGMSMTSVNTELLISKLLIHFDRACLFR
jgi:hypothetical protein